MSTEQCSHSNASVLASAPVMLCREKGRVTRVILGDLFCREMVIITCPDCGTEAALSCGVRYASQQYKRIIERGNQGKDSLATTITIRTVVQEVQERLASVEGALSLELLDELLILLLSMNASGAVLVGRHALWHEQSWPIVRVTGKNMTALGDIGLEVVLTCGQCQITQNTFFLISGLPPGGHFIHLKPTAKAHYTHVLDKRGFFVFDLDREGYICDHCKEAKRD